MSPPKTLSRSDFINAAFKLVREHGWANLTTRNLARELASSTMPFYSQFSAISDLENEVIRKAMDLVADYESRPHTGNPLLDTGIGYVLFAWEEPHLFAALNDKKHVKMQTKYGDIQFRKQVEELARHPKMKGLSYEQVRNLQFLAWTFVYGIAGMKSWIDETQVNFKKEDLLRWITDGLRALGDGYIQNFRQSSLMKKKGNKNEKK
ncbi:MAG: TetR/AcrR family transcriptional regulator [Deltaproteobacteria bacterium]|nr:TetR/AcrR family transcriptional regulator [Deltaproteobacteria bacterium]